MTTPTDVLADLWERADADNPDDGVFGTDVTEEWPAGMLAALQDLGVLEETEPARTVACEGCEEDHWPEVVIPPPGRGPDGIGYYHCRESGREEIALERLRQWRITAPGIAAAIARELGTGRSPREEAPGRLWSLGRLDTDRGLRPVWLARLGRNAVTGHESLRPLFTQGTPAPIIFTLSCPADVTLFGAAVVLPLPDVAVWKNELLHLDLRAWLDEKPAARLRRGRMGHLTRQDIEKAYTESIERDVDGNFIWPTQEAFAERLAVSPATLRRQLRALNTPWPPVPPGFLLTPPAD